MGKRYSAIIALLFLVLAAHGAAAQTSSPASKPARTPQQNLVLCSSASAGGFTGCAIDDAALQAWLSRDYLSPAFLNMASKGAKGQQKYIAALRQFYLLEVCEDPRPDGKSRPEDCAETFATPKQAKAFATALDENPRIVRVLWALGGLNDQMKARAIMRAQGIPEVQLPKLDSEMKTEVAGWCKDTAHQSNVSIAEGDSFAANVENAHAVFSNYLVDPCKKLTPADKPLPVGQLPLDTAFEASFPLSQGWEEADVDTAQRLAGNLLNILIADLTLCLQEQDCEASKKADRKAQSHLPPPPLPDPRTHQYFVVSEDGEWLEWKDVVDYQPDLDPAIGKLVLHPVPTGKISCVPGPDYYSSCMEKKALWLMEQWYTGHAFRIVEQSPTGTATPPKTDYTLHAGSARDNLALRAFAQSVASGQSEALQSDPFDTGGSFNVTPQKASSTANSFNISAQAAVGLTFMQSISFGTDQGVFDEPMILTPLIDVYYGPDKNSSSSTINRFGAGLSMAFRMDPLEPLSFLGDALKWLDRKLDPQADLDDKNSHFGEGVLQIIPEYITDSNFESKSFYNEVRYDLIDYPWFNCLSFGAKLSDLLDVNVTCGAAFIGDTLHSFKISTLQSNLRGEFGRIGGQVGFTLSPPDLPCRWEFLCNYVTEKLTAKTWYKVLSDESGNHGTIHNWTSSISYQYAPGVAFTASYTNGLEDITLLRLPTWKAGISASF